MHVKHHDQVRYLFQPLPGVGEDRLEDNAVLKDQAAVLVVLLGVLAEQHEILNRW